MSSLEPNIYISNSAVHIKVYSFELNKVVYTGIKTISNGEHPPCWYPEANLLVLEDDSNRWVHMNGQWNEPCEKFSGKYNLCVSDEPISDEITSGKEVYSKNLYVLSSQILKDSSNECHEIRFLDEGICLFIRVCDPIVEAEQQEKIQKMFDDDDE